MYGTAFANRRTVLKTIPAAAVGGGVVTGAASGAPGDGRSDPTSRTTEVEIVAEHDHDAEEHRFELSATEIPAGWTTLTLDNRTGHTHFVYLGKLPPDAIAAADQEGTDLLDFYEEHVTGPFQWFMDDINPEREPSPEDLSHRYTNLEEDTIFPTWLEKVLPSGGVGLTSGERTSTSSVNLDSGQYIAECYVKDEDGVFHAYNGMMELLTVTDERSGAPEPEADLDLSLSTAGFDFGERVRAGRQTVGVRIEDQRTYDNLTGHDVHLIRFDADTTVDDLNGWTNWTDPDQLVSDGSEPGTFLGGVQAILTPELLEGTQTETAYFEVDLNPGAYAWVSEVPEPREKGLLAPFVVPFDGG